MDDSDRFATLTIDEVLRRVSEAAYATGAIAVEPIAINEGSMGWMGARDRRRMDVRFEVFARMPEEIKANIQLVCEAMLKVEDIRPYAPTRMERPRWSCGSCTSPNATSRSVSARSHRSREDFLGDLGDLLLRHVGERRVVFLGDGCRAKLFALHGGVLEADAIGHRDR